MKDGFSSWFIVSVALYLIENTVSTAEFALVAVLAILAQQPSLGSPQFVATPKKGEAGVSIRELTGKHGIGRATYFNCRTKCGEVCVSELKRMKELEFENAKLKRMYARLALENAAIRDLLSRRL